MKSNPIAASGRVSRLALVVAGAWACGQGPTDADIRSTQVELDIGVLVGVSSSDHFVSVIDTVHLRIGSEGEDRILTRNLGPSDVDAVFDLEVDGGSVRFAVDVISNNGTLLFRGASTTVIDADAFTVSITPQPVSPVLVVEPRQPTFDTTTIFVNDVAMRFHSAMVRVRNAGIAPLTWRVDSLVQLPPGITVACFIPSLEANCLTEQTLVTETEIVTGFITPLSMVERPAEGIRFLSNVGSATIASSP